MAEAPRRRPEQHSVLLSLSGHVRARPRAVFDALAAKLRPGNDAKSHFYADAALGLIVAQGGWWYRAEYQIVPDAHGCHVDHTLLNVATRAHRFGRFTGRREIAAAPAVFEAIVQELREELE